MKPAKAGIDLRLNRLSAGLSGVNRFYPVLVLAIIPSCLTELLTGNAPLPVFLLPKNFVLLMVVYGLPALLIRDLWVSWKLNMSGLFCLGLVYGIFNEGLTAQTLLLNQHLPIQNYNGYRFFGFNWPWAFFIVPWHALYSTLFPITLVTWWFPEARNRLWLSGWLYYPATVILLLFGCLIFFSADNNLFKQERLHTQVPMLVFLLMWMAFFVLASRWFTKDDRFLERRFPLDIRPMVIGFLFYPGFVIGFALLALIHIPLLLFCVVIAAFFIGVREGLIRMNWITVPNLAAFALANYISAAVFTLIAGHTLLLVITEILTITPLTILLGRLRKAA